ncbi:MAG: type II toxin-antitoxin system RelE/ParE family toxin [Cellulomonadaceae bacterium]|jgi:toxin ParE1/3/4|nr:type II toxin-antitoxin system RelE/ParE family toxin [Cellulomonadaceae bacterium]
MGAVTYSQASQRHLLNLAIYVADERGEDIAEGLINRILRFCAALSIFPRRGRLREDIAPRLRVIGFEGSGTIAYRVADDNDDVEIIGIFYGAWDWEQHIPIP